MQRIRDATLTVADAARRVDEKIAVRVRRINDAKGLLESRSQYNNLQWQEKQRAEIAAMEAELVPLKLERSRLTDIREKRNATFNAAENFLREHKVNVDALLL
jgi:hypothetical protein